MDFLDKLVIPQPDYNLNLLNIFMILGMTIFLVYSGIMFGSTVLSVYFRNKSKNRNGNFLQLAKEYASLTTEKGAYAFGLAIIPYLSVIFIYAQLLHKTGAEVVFYLILGFVIYLAGIITAYSYHKSFILSGLFSSLKGKVTEEDGSLFEDTASISETTFKRFRAMGNWTLLLQFLGLWIFVGSIALALNSKIWGAATIINVLFGTDAIIEFLQFITIAFSVSAITYLFRKFYWDDKNEYDSEDYLDFSKKTNSWIALLSLIFVPLFFVISMFTLPKNSVNYIVFITAVFGIILVLLVLQWIYVILKEQKSSMIKYAFYTFIIVIGLLAFKDKTAFGVSNKDNVTVLNDEYVKHKDEFLASLGLNKTEINAAEIYSGRCGACHKAEDAPTAPAHKNIIGKYLTQADPKAALIKFVLNPVKVDPKYPPMPNQGLTPAEADAVAAYMLEKYGAKKEGEVKGDTKPQTPAEGKK